MCLKNTLLANNPEQARSQKQENQSQSPPFISQIMVVLINHFSAIFLVLTFLLSPVYKEISYLPMKTYQN